ncbi:MAG: hypothetical protein A4E25_01886 [Methanobacterium sp. PtaB.Bin024]|jgi:hypothetical protein|nr:MAG: hypothetical protein A4E25_01886 [Methanobacterium sp. PtaB.Bin024]
MEEENVNEKGKMDTTNEKTSRTIELVLGIIGGIFGLIGGVIGLIFVPELGFSAILASIVGIVGAIYVTKNPKWGGIILIMSSIWLLISISYFGALGFILILLAGLVAIFRK